MPYKKRSDRATWQRAYRRRLRLGVEARVVDLITPEERRRAELRDYARAAREAYRLRRTAREERANAD